MTLGWVNNCAAAAAAAAAAVCVHCMCRRHISCSSCYTSQPLFHSMRAMRPAMPGSCTHPAVLHAELHAFAHLQDQPPGATGLGEPPGVSGLGERASATGLGERASATGLGEPAGASASVNERVPRASVNQPVPRLQAATAGETFNHEAVLLPAVG
eukprot:364189-Chlamydomonas_euryale.AAC.6